MDINFYLQHKQAGSCAELDLPSMGIAVGKVRGELVVC